METDILQSKDSTLSKAIDALRQAMAMRDIRLTLEIGDNEPMSRHLDATTAPCPNNAPIPIHLHFHADTYINKVEKVDTIR